MNVGGLELLVFQRRLAGLDCLFDKIRDKRLELLPRNRLVEVFWPGRVSGDKRQVNIGLAC